MYDSLKFLFDFIEEYYDLGNEEIDAFRIDEDFSDLENLKKFILDAQKGIDHWGKYCGFILELEHELFHLEFDLNRNDGKVVINKCDFDEDPSLHFEDEILVDIMHRIEKRYKVPEDKSISRFDQVIDKLLKSSSEFSCHIDFGLAKNNTINEISKNYPWIQNYETLVFFKEDKMEECLMGFSPEDLREDFFGKEKLLIFVIGGVRYVYGNYIGIFGMKEFLNELEEFHETREEDKYMKEFLNELEEFHETREEDKLTKKLEFLSEVSFIDKIDCIAPPDCFQEMKHSNENDKKIFYDIFGAFSIIFTLIYLSNSINFEGNSCWSLKIQGERILRSRIKYKYNEEKHQARISIDDQEFPVSDLTQTTKELFEIYKFIFGGHTIERVFLARKMISISAKNFHQIVENRQNIYESIKTNWDFYLDKEVSKFIDSRQNFTDYLFRHTQELIGFHSKLSSDMSDTAFKIFGYLLVFLLGWQEKASTTVFEPYYITLGLFFLAVYVLFCLKRLTEMKDTYNDFDRQHSEHLHYYENFIDEKHFDRLTKHRYEENKKFYGRYWFYFILLIIFLILDLSFLVRYYYLTGFPSIWLGTIAIIIVGIIASILVLKYIERPQER